MSDGSYQRDVDPQVCSCAFTLECKATGKKLVCTWVERSPSASNYRGELLGALGYLLVTKAVLDYERDQLTDSLTLPKGPAFCDNMGVVKHGRVPNKPLSEKQVQADILGHMKYILRGLPSRISFKHVRGHMNEVLELSELTYQQLLQVQMDRKATTKLKTVVEEDTGYIMSYFPFERLTMSCGDQRVTASATDAIYEWTSRQTAKKLYDEKGIVSAENFDLIYWKGIGDVTTSCFTSSFSTFYSKHLIRCCGVRHHLHNIDNSVPNVCPCCGCEDETTAHIVLCPDKHRTKLYKKSVSNLITWMNDADTSPLIIEMVGKYLEARNTKTMSELYDGPRTNDENGRGWQLAQEHDLLGFQNFTEGRISSKYVDMQRQYYKSQKRYRRSETRWATEFIENLIRIIHDQWTWRNEKLHYRRHPGAETLSEYEQIMNRIMNKIEMTDPEDLLPEDQFLLGVDPEKIMKTSPDGRQAWLANLDAAVAAAEHEKRRRDEIDDDDTEEEDEDEEQSHHFRPPPVKNRCVFQGGRRWRNNLRRKRINKWKSLNFLGKHKIDDYLSDDTDNESLSNALPPTPTSPPRVSKRQTTVNKWLGHQRETSDVQSTSNQRLSSLTQPSITDAATSTRAQQSNKHQASMTNWLTHSAQMRPRVNPPPSSEDNRNAVLSENQQLEPSSSTNNRSIRSSRQRSYYLLRMEGD